MLDLKLPDFIPKAFLFRTLPKQNPYNRSFPNRNSCNQQHGPHVLPGPLLINPLRHFLETPFILHHWLIDVRENVLVGKGADSGTGVQGFQGG